MGLEQRQGIYGTYWGNTYDSSQPLTLEQQQVNARYIWAYLQARGWTLNAVAGILGNMQSESSINPGRWQNDDVLPSDPTYAGYGLVQWTPYTKYTNWIINQGFSDPSIIDANLYRIIYELNNNIQWIATEQYNYSFSEYSRSNDSPYNLALAFLANYERPENPNQPIRGTQAEYWYEYLGGLPPTPTNTYKKRKFPWVVFINNILT